MGKDIFTVDEVLSLPSRLGILRSKVLDRLFPNVREFWEGVDEFGFNFVDFRDPLELISFITLYLPGVVFMSSVLFFYIPHILNFLIFIPKMWFFRLPCLYQWNEFDAKKRRRRRKRDASADSVFTMGPCDQINLTQITRQVYNSLLKMTK